MCIPKLLDLVQGLIESAEDVAASVEPPGIDMPPHLSGRRNPVVFQLIAARPVLPVLPSH